MSDRQIEAFFYGLFMDIDVLHEGGASPSNPRNAYVADFALRIGQRATLVSSSGARAYGMLFTLTHRDLDTLYNAPGLDQYRPEAVTAQPFQGSAVAALCYNLLDAPGPNERNPEYTLRLQSALKKLHFPTEYIASVGNECGA